MTAGDTDNRNRKAGLVECRRDSSGECPWAAKERNQRDSGEATALAPPPFSFLINILKQFL